MKNKYEKILSTCLACLLSTSLYAGASLSQGSKSETSTYEKEESDSDTSDSSPDTTSEDSQLNPKTALLAGTGVAGAGSVAALVGVGGTTLLGAQFFKNKGKSASIKGVPPSANSQRSSSRTIETRSEVTPDVDTSSDSASVDVKKLHSKAIRLPVEKGEGAPIREAVKRRFK